MDNEYIKHVIDETLEMFPDHVVSDAGKLLIVKGFSRIELSDKLEKSPAVIQMIQSVVIAKMVLLDRKEYQ